MLIRENEQKREIREEQNMRLKNHYETINTLGKLVAVPIGDDTAFTGAVEMNKTAAVIFEMLKKETTEDSIVEALAQQFDAPRERIAEDVHRCLDAFRQKDLLTE